MEHTEAFRDFVLEHYEKTRNPKDVVTCREIWELFKKKQSPNTKTHREYRKACLNDTLIWYNSDFDYRWQKKVGGKTYCSCILGWKLKN